MRLAVVFLCLLALAACGRSQSVREPAQSRVSIERLSAARWRVDYALKSPVAAIDLGPSIGGFRGANWAPADDAARIVTRGGRDYVEPADGRRAIRRATFLVAAAPVDLYKDYEPFVSMGDGGALVYTGHFIPFGADGRRMPVRLTVAGRAGEHVAAFSDVAARLEDWQSPFDHPSFIYVGAQQPRETDALVAIVDASAPAWIREEISTFAPAIAATLRAVLERALPQKPNIFVAMGDFSEEGRIGYSGDALPGQYRMTLAGGGWRAPSEKARAVLRRSTAHEAAHLWQAAARPKSDAVAEWIHEGGADALAAAAMREGGFWTEEDLAADQLKARGECAAALRQRSLRRAEAERLWDGVYACGRLINDAAAGEAGIAAFWRDFIARTAQDGYDEAAFLALAEERAGPGTVAAIRDMTRINEARSERAIERLLK